MGKKKKKRNKKTAESFGRILPILSFFIPILVYAFYILKRTHFPMLDTDGYNYIWFWNILKGGRVLGMQTTVPKPLLIILYGILSNGGMNLIEVFKIIMAGLFGLSFYYLAYKFSQHRFDAFVAVIFVSVLPSFLFALTFGNSVIYSTALILLGFYLYFKEEYLSCSFALFFSGLIRPDAWGISIALVLIDLFLNKKLRYILLLALFAPVLWMLSDKVLTNNMFYSFGIVSYYIKSSGFPPLPHSLILHKWWESLIKTTGFYTLILSCAGLVLGLVKKEKNVIILFLLILTLMLQVSLSVYRGGLFMDRFAFAVGVLYIVFIPFFLFEIFKDQVPVLRIIIMVLTFAFLYKTINYQYLNMWNIIDIEKSHQMTAFEIAPQIALIDDQNLIVPGRRIGIFSFYTGKPYLSNFVSGRDFIYRNLKLKDFNYIVYIRGDYTSKAAYFFGALDGKNTIQADNLTIEKVFETSNGAGKIFNIIPSSQTRED